MSKNLLGALGVVGLVVGLAGCGGPQVIGARALLPLQGEDTSRVWIYMDSNENERDGVYRCIDEGGQVACVRANLRNQ